MLRDARDLARLLSSFDAWRPQMLHLLHRSDGREAFSTLITYLYYVVDRVCFDVLRARIDELGRHAKEATMTIAEWLEEKGRKEGHEEGREEGRIAMLRSLLTFKFKLEKLDERTEMRLRAATPEAIERYARRVLTSDSLATVFDD